MKHKIRLTESDLHRIVKESVNNVLNETGDTEIGRGKNRAVKFKQDTQELISYLSWAKDKLTKEIQNIGVQISNFDHYEKIEFGREDLNDLVSTLLKWGENYLGMRQVISIEREHC